MEKDKPIEPVLGISAGESGVPATESELAVQFLESRFSDFVGLTDEEIADFYSQRGLEMPMRRALASNNAAAHPYQFYEDEGYDMAYIGRVLDSRNRIAAKRGEPPVFGLDPIEVPAPYVEILPIQTLVTEALDKMEPRDFRGLVDRVLAGDLDDVIRDDAMDWEVDFPGQFFLRSMEKLVADGDSDTAYLLLDRFHDKRWDCTTSPSATFAAAQARYLDNVDANRLFAFVNSRRKENYGWMQAEDPRMTIGGTFLLPLEALVESGKLDLAQAYRARVEQYFENEFVADELAEFLDAPSILDDPDVVVEYVAPDISQGLEPQASIEADQELLDGADEVRKMLAEHWEQAVKKLGIPPAA